MMNRRTPCGFDVSASPGQSCRFLETLLSYAVSIARYFYLFGGGWFSVEKVVGSYG